MLKRQTFVFLVVLCCLTLFNGCFCATEAKKQSGANTESLRIFLMVFAGLFSMGGFGAILQSFRTWDDGSKSRGILQGRKETIIEDISRLENELNDFDGPAEKKLKLHEELTSSYKDLSALETSINGISSGDNVIRYVGIFFGLILMALG